MSCTKTSANVLKKSTVSLRDEYMMHSGVMNFLVVFVRKPFKTNRTCVLFLYSAFVFQVSDQGSLSLRALVEATAIFRAVDRFG